LSFINPTHEALAQLIELGAQLSSQLRGHLLTLQAKRMNALRGKAN
jgi:hypothetical protein